MSVENIFRSADSVWGLWKIQEDEASLAAEVPVDHAAATLVNPLKRLEFLAGRALIKRLLKEWDLPYQGIRKDAFGKPFLSDYNFHISLSHSHPYVAAILHKTRNVGIDLEQPKPKLLRIAHRVLSPEELADAGEDIVKHCIYWCAKEALIKIYGKKDLIFSKNLLVEPFELNMRGLVTGRIVAGNMQTAIPLSYIVTHNFVVVVSD